MGMIQTVEEFSDVHLQNCTTCTVHRLLPKRLQRTVCRSPRPEAERAVVEVLLVDRFQQHDDRPLQDLVLQRGNPDRARLGLRAALRNVHTSHRRSLVRAGLGAVEQRLEIRFQVLLVFRSRHSVHAHRPVFARAAVRFAKPVDVHQVGQGSESHLRRLLGQLCYPLLFRGHACRISMHSPCFLTTGP